MYKIVYSIIEHYGNIYFNELYFSLKSLRLHNPMINVEILTDKYSIENIKNNTCIYEYIDNNAKIILNEIPNCYSQKQKSRYLKTSLRGLVEGDFLFIDTDTIICRELPNNISDKEFAVVLDRNRRISTLTDDHTQEIYKKCGIEMPNFDYYLNSGVMWVKDSKQNYDLFNKWHNLWKEKVDDFYACMDQPSFNEVIFNNNIDYELLDGYYNCQIASVPFPSEYVDDAYIIHYYNNKNRFIGKIEELLKEDNITWEKWNEVFSEIKEI